MLKVRRNLFAGHPSMTVVYISHQKTKKTNSLERRIPQWLWDNAPRYDSTVDACVGPFSHVILPEESKVAPHHKVRNEVASKPREGQPLIARRTVDWVQGTHPEDESGDHSGEGRSCVEFEETLQHRFMEESDTDLKPEAHSTPHESRGATSAHQDDSSSSPLKLTFLPLVSRSEWTLRFSMFCQVQ